MYTATLFLHSLLRWVVLALGIVAVVRAARGMSGSGAFTAGDAKTSRVFVIVLDVQMLLGLLLYAWLSPITHAAFSSFGAAMKDRTLRFWMVEHPFSMICAIAFAHVGAAMLKRQTEPRAKHKKALVWFSLAVVALLVGVPWPFLPYGRPLLSLP